MKIDLKKLFQKILHHRRGPKIFVAVFTILLSCISFGSCENVLDKAQIIFSGDYIGYTTGFVNVFRYGNFGAGTYCINITSDSPQQVSMGFANGALSTPSNLYTLYGDQYGNWICLYGNKEYFNIRVVSGTSGKSNHFKVFRLPDLLNTEIVSSCPAVYTGKFTLGFNDISNGYTNYGEFYFSPYSYDEYGYTISYNDSVVATNSDIYEISFSSAVSCGSCESDLLQCQSDYLSCSSSLGNCGTSLNSCQVSLGNCMQGNVGTGENWSAIYINDIQHLGKPIINITIPGEIARDYVSTGQVFDLNVSGYNVDTEYIENVIDVQNTKPSQDDFNKIISEVIPLFVPGLFIILFIYFVFRLVKKVF